MRLDWQRKPSAVPEQNGSSTAETGENGATGRSKTVGIRAIQPPSYHGMQQADAQVALVETHVQAFRKMLRDRWIDGFDDWLATALASGIPAFRSFAKGVQQDYHAVKAGLSME